MMRGGEYTSAAVGHNVTFRLRVRGGCAGGSPPAQERTGDQAEVSGHTSGAVGYDMLFRLSGE